ncbi:MAG: hypothetical protein ACTHLT_05740 [Devosia sp.]
MSVKHAAISLLTVGLLTVPALAESAVTAEKNPPGDIPDSQVFVDYKGPGFTIKVPEGWSRTDEAAGARFADKYNTIEVTVATAAAAPTLGEVSTGEAKSLVDAGRAVKVASVKDVKLDGGRAIRIDYAANSQPNAVTNKQIRLEDVRFLLFKAGKLVTLDMSAPLGADNVDQWNLMANSIRIQ